MAGKRNKKKSSFLEFNPYKKEMFGVINRILYIFLVIGFVGAFFILFEEDGTIYKSIALLIISVWVFILLRYFFWAIYHYNINFGLTDKDWYKIFEARERKSLGENVHEDDLKGPDSNPYRSQTFGLPPGTVRGMIAFTLLFGALAMMVLSMGMEGEIREDSFFWDHFEFFKTAFLMMIAFYFGSRSLKYLQKRWPSAQQNQQPEDNQYYNGYRAEDYELRQESDPEDLDDMETERRKGLDLTSLKRPISTSESENNSQGRKTSITQLEHEYKQIRDNTFQKHLSDGAIEELIDSLGIPLELPVIKAIIEIESTGGGFLKSEKPKILFEGHKFWYWLKQEGDGPNKYLPGNEDILYPKWTKEFYKGGESEYSRFYRAASINKKAAICSTSWGLFQVLGENAINGNVKRHADVFEFYDKQFESEYEHLLDFIDFITNKTFKGKPIISLVEGNDPNKYDWDSFAYAYNGSGYKKNSYHTRLKKAHDKYYEYYNA